MLLAKLDDTFDERWSELERLRVWQIADVGQVGHDGRPLRRHVGQSRVARDANGRKVVFFRQAETSAQEGLKGERNGK